MKEVRSLNPEVSFDECFFGSATVGERGQIVIPSEARKKFSIHPGDKLLVMAHPTAEGLMLFKMGAVRKFFSTMLEGLTKVEQELSATDG
jgi:AbrB family looped-hinge helix DNA binding protein